MPWFPWLHHLLALLCIDNSVKYNILGGSLLCPTLSLNPLCPRSCFGLRPILHWHLYKPCLLTMLLGTFHSHCFSIISFNDHTHCFITMHPYVDQNSLPILTHCLARLTGEGIALTSEILISILKWLKLWK